LLIAGIETQWET